MLYVVWYNFCPVWYGIGGIGGIGGTVWSSVAWHRPGLWAGAPYRGTGVLANTATGRFGFRCFALRCIIVWKYRCKYCHCSAVYDSLRTQILTWHLLLSTNQHNWLFLPTGGAWKGFSEKEPGAGRLVLMQLEGAEAGPTTTKNCWQWRRKRWTNEECKK